MTNQMREVELAKCPKPKDEVERIAQIVLSIIKHPDGMETIDWEIARAIAASPKQGKLLMIKQSPFSEASRYGAVTEVLRYLDEHGYDPKANLDIRIIVEGSTRTISVQDMR